MEGFGERFKINYWLKQTLFTVPFRSHVCKLANNTAAQSSFWCSKRQKMKLWSSEVTPDTGSSFLFDVKH